MKTILTRTLVVALLTTSMSAFAKSNEGKSADAATPTNVTQQNDCNRTANEAAQQDEQKSSIEKKIAQQDKDWQHDLQGTYGG